MNLFFFYIYVTDSVLVADSWIAVTVLLLSKHIRILSEI